MERSLSFGSAADTYHRHRPDYPDSLVDRVLAHATGDVRRAIEVGAGTGLATSVFARRGIDVTAVEPDPAMGAVLSSQIDAHSWPVELVATTFEAVSPATLGTFDLLFSAAAFHWTDPATRWGRVAELVRPGGVIALFGATRDLADPALRDRVHAVMSHVMGEDPPGQWSADELRRQPTLTDVVETEIVRRATMSADDYIAFLTTISAYAVLPHSQRDDLLGTVRAMLPDLVEVAEDIPLHLARRTDHGTS